MPLIHMHVLENTANRNFLGKFSRKTETLRSISSLIPASFGCVFGMVGKLSEQAFQRVFFHIFFINVQIVMNFLKIKDQNCLYTCFLGKFLLFVQFQSRLSMYVTQTHI